MLHLKTTEIRLFDEMNTIPEAVLHNSRRNVRSSLRKMLFSRKRFAGVSHLSETGVGETTVVDFDPVTPVSACGFCSDPAGHETQKPLELVVSTPVPPRKGQRWPTAGHKVVQ